MVWLAGKVCSKVKETIWLNKKNIIPGGGVFISYRRERFEYIEHFTLWLWICGAQ